MAMTRNYYRSFNGGVIAPDGFGRLDDPKYQSGLAICRNFIPLPHGPAQNRTGTAFVRSAKYPNRKCRLIPFAFSTTQTMVLEFGHQYLRFHTLGATLESSPGVAYEIATPFQESELWDIRYTQSADVLTLVHPLHPPCELRRLGALNWTITNIGFGTTMVPPASAAVTAFTNGGTTGLTAHEYAITSVSASGIDESLERVASPSVNNNLHVSGAYNTITWPAAPGAAIYNVYKRSSGVWGFIGQTTFLTFTDNNIAANLAKTPPLGTNPFAGASSYPGAVTYFEQRRIFGGTVNQPQNLWMTRSGTESNLNYSIPSRDDDAISIRVSAREVNAIQHLVPMSNLIALTNSAEWRIGSGSNEAITPTNISVRPQSFIGANNVQPAAVNNNLIYAAARGGHIREMTYDWQASGYVTGDLSLRAPHLFDGKRIVDMAYAKAPVPIVWALSSDGSLRSLTYVPEQQVGAWAVQDTRPGEDAIESICVVAEGDEDILYLSVRRTINLQTVRYIERKREQILTTLADAFHVDCGATYSGDPVTHLEGLTWLEGCMVNILSDGAVHPQRQVLGGAITLDQPAAKIQVGLPIQADLQTLPMSFDIPGMGQGRPKNVNKVWLRVHNASGIFAGPSFNKLSEVKQRTTEPAGTPPNLKTDELELMVSPSWSAGGQICVRQSDPLPLTLVAMTVEASIGG